MRGTTTAERPTAALVALGCWLVVAPIGLLALSQALGVTGSRNVTIVQTLTPYIGLLLVPVAAYALWRRHLALTTAAVAVGAGLLVLSAPLAFPDEPPPARPGATGVQVAAANLLYLNDRVDEAADALAEVDADVMILLEYSEAHRQALRTHPLTDRYPVRIDRPDLGSKGIAVWSTYPIDASELGVRSLDVTVDGPDGPVRMVAVHTPTPTDDFDLWQAELDTLAEYGRSDPGPSIVIGDLNATFWHPQFRRLLDAGFVDAHIATGKGFHTSWPTDRIVPPFAQLDHALTTDGLVPTDVTAVDVPGSDHRGLVVSVVPAQ